MNYTFVNDIVELAAMLKQSPLYVILAIGIFTILWVFLRITKDIKFEHLFQHTISNKLCFIKKELKEGVIDEQQQIQLRQRYDTLLNEKIYGVKNSFIQREVINIISGSSEIKDFKYFAGHKYVLSVDSEGRLFFNRKKIKARIIDGVALLIIGLSALFLGIIMLKASLIFGLFVCLPGIIIYFSGLGYFPASHNIRKRAEKEIANYYQHRNTSET